MRALFDQLVAANPIEKPDAAQMQRELGIEMHPASPRRWVSGWWKEHEASMGMTRPEPAEPKPPTSDASEDKDTA